MLKAEVMGVPVHIWFTPSFNIKTTDNRLEGLLRTTEVKVFDPWEMRVRKAKATRSLIDAYLVLEEFQYRIPEAKIKFEETPEVPSSIHLGDNSSPVVE
jgi:hypothetical protein